MTTLIAIQDEYIARVLACTNGHLNRVRRGARKAAFTQLAKLGYSLHQQRLLVWDADQVAQLERIANDVEDEDDLI